MTLDDTKLREMLAGTARKEGWSEKAIGQLLDSARGKIALAFGRAVRDVAWEIAAEQCAAQSNFDIPEMEVLGEQYVHAYSGGASDCATRIRSLIPEQKDGVAAREVALGKEER